MILLGEAALSERRRLAAGSLAPLADSLAQDLEPLARASEIYVPSAKARLTRAGGRCPQCGTMLEFDPWSAQRHHCARCKIDVTGDEHDGMWIMWYQLWLAERALHAAALYAERGDVRHRALAERILAAYAERYLSYPNRDNVLGPTRPFFSTYLESIWTLQLACALDLLETVDGQASLGQALRDRLLQPSAVLIGQYDEGLSNRQVWNNAALLASGLLLGDASMTQRAVTGRSGLVTHLTHGLLADGTWYEGENYHLFAHRGLWYAMTLATRAGMQVAQDLHARYVRAFATPFMTALPDFTFPSRRDSQYRVSLRQWRIAESCELGLAEAPSEVLASAQHELYRTDVPRQDTGRDRSTAEAERNVPASRLTRADLGWKSLLFAAADGPPAGDANEGLRSVLLPHQGLAILRRDQGQTYVALDYGESGGGHGHPDRLNLWLVVGEARILEDVGTGSYVDPSLHWYRSTLAHNAPLVDGSSQQRADGELLAYDERGDFGWTLAASLPVPNVMVERAVVAAPGYLVDEVLWTGAAGSVIDVPYHVAGESPSVTAWTQARIPGGGGLEDGFDHVTNSEHSEPLTTATIRANVAGLEVTLWLTGDSPFVLWRLRAPGPPNEKPRDFFLARSQGATGRLRSVISWSPAVTSVQTDDDRLLVALRDGARHTHTRREDDWHIAFDAAARGSRSPIVLSAGSIPRIDRETHDLPQRLPRQIRVPRLSRVDLEPGALAVGAGTAYRAWLGADHYRRSEQSWEDAGPLEASVALAATPAELHIDIVVHKESLAFASARKENPLDNEHPDVNSDGVQLYLGSWSWLLVPEQPAPNVRVTPRHEASAGPAPELRASWRAMPGGYAVRIVAPLAAFATSDGSLLGDVIVNEMPAAPERERRRGQLVLSGANGEWVYLRGDRHDPARFLQFVLADA